MCTAEKSKSLLKKITSPTVESEHLNDLEQYFVLNFSQFENAHFPTVREIITKITLALIYKFTNNLDFCITLNKSNKHSYSFVWFHLEFGISIFMCMCMCTVNSSGYIS